MVLVLVLVVVLCTGNSTGAGVATLLAHFPDRDATDRAAATGKAISSSSRTGVERTALEN
jgi:hypothetical protein